ncbi:MAG: type II secretion system protein GspN, partial [Bdellovibrionales bacterium]
MNAFWAGVRWLLAKKGFFAAMLLSALLFFAWLFPFSDLSDMVTSMVAQATGGKVSVQFESLDLHLVPQPAVSATGLRMESSLPALEAQWVKFTPGLLHLLLKLPTTIRAIQGDPEAGRALASRVGFAVDAEGLFGGDLELNVGPGKTSEQGAERSRVSLTVDKVSLNEVEKWADLQVPLRGQATLQTEMNLNPEFKEQPEGDYSVQIKKFSIPSTTVMIPFQGANMPVNLPAITLNEVVLRGRLVNGTLFIEEGRFGASQDPLSGRIKGQLGLRLQPVGAGVT